MFTRAEAAAIALVTLLAAAIVLAYCGDTLGLSLHPIPILLLSLAASAAIGWSLWARAPGASGDLIVFVAIAGAVLAWLLWLAWPDLLPTGGDPDLTHHLLLVDYIDRTGRLVHDRTLVPYFGEMIDYTPGVHLLAVLAGRWMRTDGLHAVYPLVAATVALKAGLVFLIAMRCLPAATPQERMPQALVAPLLLFVPQPYFLGSFVHDSYLAQVVSELFAVAAWWALVCWDQKPAAIAATIAGVAGAATFLTWPVWTGPVLITCGLVALLRRDTPVAVRARHLTLAGLPVVTVAVVYASGRISAATIAGATGFALRPTPATAGWLFLGAGILGTLIAVTDRQSRTIPIILGAMGVQAAALFVAARRSGAETPYLALKMFYLAIYPLAVAGSIAVAVLVRSAIELFSSLLWRSPSGLRERRAKALRHIHEKRSKASRSIEAARSILHSPAPNGARGVNRARVTWGLVGTFALWVGWSVWSAPRETPAISQALYDAGRWARAHLPPSCVDYLVGDDDGAYWLHVVVLGNPRGAKRSLASETYEMQKAVLRWIFPGGLPYAIAGDIDALPRDIRTNVDILARFGRAGVIKRRGVSSCTP